MKVDSAEIVDDHFAELPGDVPYSSTTYDYIRPPDADNQTFEGHDWILNDENHTWHPGEYPTNTPTINKTTINQHSVQDDSGANRIVTDNLSNLRGIKTITPITMGGCNKDDIAITCTATGYLPIITVENEILLFKAYYSAEVDGTIISPTAMVRQHQDKFQAWVKYCDCDSNKGSLKLLGRNGQHNTTFNIYCHNDLWYHEQHTVGEMNSSIIDADDTSSPTPTIHKLGNAASYELWHQRLCHPGTDCMSNIHHHSTGVPQLKGNAFYRCPSCMSGKLSTKRPIGKKNPTKGSVCTHTTEPHTHAQPPLDDDIHVPHSTPGQHFHMDFGFVRGSEFSLKNEKGGTITSIDGYNSYLSIIDRKSRYMWIFLTSSKTPPVEAVQKFLNKFKSTNTHRTVRVDQGGELGKSHDFINMIGACDYVLETTGADASAQNGLVERPNRTLGQMMRCILHSAELGPEYWSFALTHAVYIKNRLPHKALDHSPYQEFTGLIPDLSNLRIFGSRIYTRKPGKRTAKLDHHVYKGTFLGFSATNKNIYFIDDDTGKIKLTTHAIFDEAAMTLPSSKAPLAAQTLQRLGYYSKEDWVTEHFNQTSNHKFLIQQLTSTATIPTRATPESIGYDLSLASDQPITIPAGTIMPLPTGIAIQCPQGTYARIAPRSGLTIKQHLTTMAGVIDPDYRGDVTELLHNFGNDDQIIQPQQKIAQIILEQAIVIPVDVVNELIPTMRGKDGFGSTDTPQQFHHTSNSHTAVDATDAAIHPNAESHSVAPNATPTDNPTTIPKPATIPLQLVDKLQPSQFNIDVPNTTFNADIPYSAAAARLFGLPKQTATSSILKLYSDIQTTFETPYDIHISHDPYDNHTHRILNIHPSDIDPYFGLNIQICTKRDLPILVDCKRGTSAMKIQKWKSELRNAYITSINDTPIHSINDIKTQFEQLHQHKPSAIKIGFSTIKKQSMHPQHGIPQLYHDQMNHIGKHLWEIANDPAWQKDISEEIAQPITDATIKSINAKTLRKLGHDQYWHLLHKLPEWFKISKMKKSRPLTRTFLQQQPDWNDWKLSEFKQLDQYEAQGTFGTPVQLPKGSNLLPLLWTYLIKDCGTKKARCVCNGSAKQKGTITLGDTYAGSLEQTGSRIFWAATAINNFITIGADASNAFAEAPPPKAPLYVKIDKPFRQWYAHKYPDKPPLSENLVLPVNGALQGHPESARLWAKLIDRIIKDLNLKACTHEPCLYYTNNYDNTGKTVLLLRQVDDFAISCSDKDLADQIIEKINNKMTIDVKGLGMIHRFNGVDVHQTKDYIKLYNETYLNKIFARHTWLHQEKDKHLAAYPIPMNPDPSFQRELENQPIPTPQEIHDLELEYGFGYRQAIGELIYALVTCRPDISYPVIKLSQYSTRPTRLHFEAIKVIYRYLNHTKTEGLIFWQKHQRTDLKHMPVSIDCKADGNYDESSIRERTQNCQSTMFAAVDSDYAGDTSHRRSVTGIIIRIAGGTVFYKTKFQDTIALSSTEAEFTAAAEAGKYILYVRSILDEIGLPQQEATILYEDNQGALLMANAQQPTKRTRHMDIKTFVLQDWVERDLIRLKRIDTSDNYSDVMTKATGRTLFHRHVNYIFGKIRPHYAT